MELEKICSFYVAKEGELIDEVSLLMKSIEDREPVDSTNTLQRTISAGERAGESSNLRPSSSRSRPSEDDIDESASDDDDETTGLTRPRKNSATRSTGRLPGLRRDQTDMTASSDVGRSLRRLSTTVDDYGEQSMMYSSAVFSSAIMLKKRIISLYVQLCELKSYVQLNRTGFAKVLKKFDKILDKELKSSYIQANVDTAYPFRQETKHVIEEKIHQMEAAYAEVVTGGDEELAKKDLRSHLREHVVWERNTVWRDLIGIERRGEAASLGQALLGRPQGAVRIRLQGDEEHEAPSKKIVTPLGRLSFPVWLLNSSIFTLLACIAIFLLLLFLPIMERPEQQNCLAMLVFVSLLWATETIPLFVTSLLIPFLSVLLNVVCEEEANKPHTRLDSKAATAAIFASMWTPVIMLLLGGFTLAAALSKCKIDKRLATLVLSKAGTQPRTVLVANMFVAAFASMLISNVAAPVLCYSIIEVSLLIYSI